MERIIKFRAWYPLKKTMAYDAEYGLDKILEVLKVDPSRYILMQFTGLLDANGKDIYEGDILHWTSDEEDSDGCNYEVIFDNSAWKIRWINPNWSVGENQTLIETYDLEIIGNIYQNPNLLNRVDKINVDVAG